jgi:large subunit ribosomal protein L20
MARVTNTPAKLRRKKRLRKAAKGYWGAHSKLHKVLKENLHRAWAYGYIGRKIKKRDMKSLWIVRLSAAARERGLPYSRFMQGLKAAGIEINRKVLSELAIHDPKGFDTVFARAKAAIAG